MIDITDTPHGLHLDTDGGTPVTLSPDTVAAIVQHELGKLGLWWAEEQRALVTTTPDEDGYFLVLELDGLADVLLISPTAGNLLQTLVEAKPTILLVDQESRTPLHIIVGLVRRADPALHAVANVSEPVRRVMIAGDVARLMRTH